MKTGPAAERVANRRLRWQQSLDEAISSIRMRWLECRPNNSLSLTRNDHADNYCTATQWIEDYSPELFEHDPPEAIEAMKRTNTIWSLQIYPDTPIGFVRWNRATLAEVIDAAMAEMQPDSQVVRGK